MVELSKRLPKFKAYLLIRYSRNTAKQYYNALRNYRIDQMDQDDLDHFLISKVYNKNNNPFYLGFVKSYIHCFKSKLVIVKSKRKNPSIKKEYKFLTKEEINRILKHLKVNNKVMWLKVRLYFETGLRLRELLNMKKSNIDLKGRIMRGVGKGNKRFAVKFSPFTAIYLEKYIDACPYENLFHRTYSNKNKKQVDEGKSFWYFLRKECSKLGLERVHPHRLRHALGHYLRTEKKFDLQQIKVKLRHSSLATTEIYTKATSEEVDEKIDREMFGVDDEKGNIL